MQICIQITGRFFPSIYSLSIAIFPSFEENLTYISICKDTDVDTITVQIGVQITGKSFLFPHTGFPLRFFRLLQIIDMQQGRRSGITSGGA